MLPLLLGRGHLLCIQAPWAEHRRKGDGSSLLPALPPLRALPPLGMLSAIRYTLFC